MLWNRFSNSERLVPKEENERWIRAPPNCNPFDMRASFTCSSLSCKARVPQATYGRSRLNTATGIERPSSSGIPLALRNNGYRGRECTEQARSNDSLLTDCRQHEDGCFSSHLRWLSMKEFNGNRSQSNSRPVVYVPVLCETICDTNIHGTVRNSITSDDSHNVISKPSSPSPSSSSSLLLQQKSTTFPITSAFASADDVNISASGCISIPVNYSTDMVAHQLSSRKFDKAEEETEVEEEKDRIMSREEKDGKVTKFGLLGRIRAGDLYVPHSFCAYLLNEFPAFCCAEKMRKRNTQRT
uniref:Uncharacterized protein n=1 Tax=Setaria digitata TaxID=48799 RepID=A0A915PMM5_9BILA